MGSKEAQLKQQMSDLQLKNVQFVGYIDDINEEFRKASVFVCSSRFEGFGMVILEAQANELPVVSFDCPYGPSELIKDGYTGILVENGDVPALSAGIEKLINDKDLRSRLAIEAKKWSESFHVTGICDRWEKLLKQVI